MVLYSYSKGGNISIHAPHAGSDFDVNETWLRTGISIHAPHAGSDRFFTAYNDLCKKFQSTLPMRGATITLHILPMIK